VHDPNHVTDWNLIQVKPEGVFQVQLVHILGRKAEFLCNQVIGLVKVQWTHYDPKDFTWVHQDAMWKEYL